MKVVNLTGHPFALYDAEGELVDVPPDPRYVGLVSIGDHRTVRDENGRAFSLNVRRIQDVKGLPEAVEGTIYVVPIEVAMALRDSREDVVYLAEEAEVRSSDGQTRRVSHLRKTVTSFEENRRLAPREKGVPSNHDEGISSNDSGMRSRGRQVSSNDNRVLSNEKEDSTWMS